MYSVEPDSYTSYRNRRSWLQAEGSLTARLRRHGAVQVVLLFQGTQRLGPEEAIDLKCRVGYVREVVITVNRVPAVWARSITSCMAVQGPWQSLKTLGNRPLAELLFSDRYVSRGRLHSHRIARHGLMECSLRDSWIKVRSQNAPNSPPRWARSSVFFRKGKSLRVLEAFAPWVFNLELL
jgi:chorismate--pyruvate lyase